MIDSRAVYLVRIPGIKQPALGLFVTQGKGWIGFFDTNRPHQIEGELDKLTPDGFIWWAKDRESPDRGRIRFTLLTIEEFNQSVRDTVELADLLPDFKTTDDLHEFYRREYEWARP